MCIFWSGALELTKKNVGRDYEYLKKVGEKTLYEMKCVHINYGRHDFWVIKYFNPMHNFKFDTMFLPIACLIIVYLR